MPDANIERLGFLLANTARIWRTKLDQRLKPLGLSVGKWTTLAYLARGSDKLTQRELATHVGIEEPTLAGILDRLQKDGWIKRENSSYDRRCKTVHLQKHAAPILDQIFSTARELRHELLADIPREDIRACMRVLEQIRKRAEAASLNGVEHRAERRNGRAV